MPVKRPILYVIIDVPISLRKADHAIFLFKVEVMMEGIIRAFKDRVAGVGWIDNQTVQAVREKVSKRC